MLIVICGIWWLLLSNIYVLGVCVFEKLYIYDMLGVYLISDKVLNIKIKEWLFIKYMWVEEVVVFVDLLVI